MIRCMLSVGSGSNSFGALKVTIYVKFFKLSVHKMSTFLRISACQWTIPSDFLAKKSQLWFYEVKIQKFGPNMAIFGPETF